MKSTAALWLLLLLWSPMAFGSFNSGGSRPVEKEWREEVRLRTGETVMVDRSVGSRSPALSFKWNGRTIKSGDDLPGMPHVIDVYDGVLILVVAISGTEQCIKYGYPDDSLVAWRYDGGKWVRMESAPDNVLVNLRNNFPERDDNEVVTLAWKQKNQGRNAGGPYGMPLAAYAAKFSEGCPRLPSAPNANIEAMTANVARVEDTAPTVIAERLSFEATPQEVSSTASMGDFIDYVPVFMARKCRDSIEVFRPRQRQGRGGHLEPAGYAISLYARVPNALIIVRGKPDYVFCDDRTILVFRHGVAERVLVTRYQRSGRLIDASWVKLPGVAQVSTDPKAPPTIWNVRLTDSQLGLTLADYKSRDAFPTSGGMLRTKAVYEARLPDR